MMMPLLQTGAHANIDVNLSTIPFANLIVLFVGIFMLLGMALFVLVKYVKKTKYFEIGGAASGEALIAEMEEKRDSLDEALQLRVANITAGAHNRARNIFGEYEDACPAVKLALVNSFLHPLFNSAAHNHFTTVFAPERREGYIDGMLLTARDEYAALRAATASASCAKGQALPPWDGEGGIRGRVREFYGEWLRKAAAEVVKTCARKIAVYKKYEKLLARDADKLEAVRNSIEKNKNYIALLDRGCA